VATGTYQGKACSADTVKKRLEFQGIPICVDRPKGFVMEGTDASGTPWKRVYKYDYGFIPKTLGGDGDGLDVFLGPNAKAGQAYWVTQKKDDGTFDEYKVFLGFNSREEATAAYVEHIPRKLLDGMATLSLDMMKSMLRIEPTGRVKTAMVLVSCLTHLDKLGEEDARRRFQDAHKAVQRVTQAAVGVTPRAAAEHIRDRLREELFG